MTHPPITDDIDIPSLIERAQDQSRPTTCLPSDTKALMRDMAEALSRLRASPLPEEIAELQEWLKAAQGLFPLHGVEFEKAAAALELMAREIQRLERRLEDERHVNRLAIERYRAAETELEDCNGVHQRAQVAEARIRELEAERDDWKTIVETKNGDLLILTARIRELEAALSSQWRGIESAPKYVSLLLANDRKEVGVGCYADHIRGDYWLWDYEGEPTHWQPLPSPPTPEEKTGE